MGIPFAEPPVGGNRFKDPQPITKPYPGGVYKALKHGNACPQAPDDHERWFLAEDDISEDCLYLNVLVPYPPKDNRAVMVFLHGAFHEGTSSFPALDGVVLTSYGEVILVHIQFRISILGYIPLDIPGQTRGNQGLKDQQMALRWVQENIEQFGGDPNEVTLFGSSSGATSIGLHLLIPSSKDLFTRAIIQGGSPLSAFASMSTESINYFVELLRDKYDCSLKPSMAECLREVPVMDLYYSALSLPSRNAAEIAPLYWLPTIDGEFIPDKPDVLLESGRVNQKDVMIGVNKDEGSTLTIGLSASDPNAYAIWSAFSAVAGTQYGAVQPDAIPNAYRPVNISNGEEIVVSAANIIADCCFVCPINKFVQQYVRHGSKVYHYLLTYRSPGSPLPEFLGVAHAEEIQWIMGHPFWTEEMKERVPSYTYNREEEELSKSVMSMWVNFAKYGNPVVSNEAAWDTTSVNADSYLELRGPYDFVYQYNKTFHEEKCKFW